MYVRDHDLLAADRRHLIHPFHCPIDHEQTPAPGDVLLFAPPLVITEEEIDTLVCAAHDAVQVVAAAPC
jgi:adenosylmethionine-8-amino-7-oxononanoate aminotransferase